MPALLFIIACTAPSHSPAPTGNPLARAESLYADLRIIRDRIDVKTEAGRAPSADVILRHNALRDNVARSLAAVDSAALKEEDTRALSIMRRTLVRDLGPITSSTASQTPSAETPPGCDYDPGAVAAGRTASTRCGSGSTPVMAGSSLI